MPFITKIDGMALSQNRVQIGPETLKKKISFQQMVSEIACFFQNLQKMLTDNPKYYIHTVCFFSSNLYFPAINITHIKMY